MKSVVKVVQEHRSFKKFYHVDSLFIIMNDPWIQTQGWLVVPSVQSIHLLETTE